MILKWLYLRNFRSFETFEIEFSERVNEIIGKNAQGKTSLLEALYVCMTGGSFRTSSLIDLIRYEEEGFFIEVGYEKEGILYEIRLSFDGVKRRISINRHPIQALSLLIGHLLGVICTPEVQSLVKGSPQVRRHFLDFSLAQLDPLYVHHITRYNKALKQRNILLKTKELRTISAWEQELSVSASYITQCRKLYTNDLEKLLTKNFKRLSTQEKELSLSYEAKSTAMTAEQFQQEFARRRPQETLFGSTLVGPHRDDLEILISERGAKQFASEGEMRLIALSLKLAEWEYLKEKSSLLPLLMIDDFAAYLDRERTELLYQIISECGQVFITAHSAQGQSPFVIIEQGRALQSIRS